MSNIQEIADKYLRLVAVFEDKNLGENSAEAQSLLAELTEVSSNDFVAAYKIAYVKMSRNQKQFIDLKVRTAVLKLRQDSRNQQTKTQNTDTLKDNTTNTGAQMPKAQNPTTGKDNTTNTDNQDTAPTPKPNTAAKPNAAASTPDRFELPDKIAQDLHTYLYTDADDYSDDLADYLSKEGISPKDKRKHSLNLLSALKKETYKPLQASTHLDRGKLVGLTMLIYREFIKTPDEAVQKKIDDLLKRLSDKSQRGYVARATQKNQFGEDLFLKDIMAARNPDSQDYVDRIIAGHVTELLEKLDDKQKVKYIAAQKRKGYIDYMPKIKVKVDENDSAKPKRKKGDNTMADDNKGNAFEPSEVQKKACEFAGLDWKNYKDNDSISKAIADQGLLISGNKIIDLTTESLVATVEPKTDEEKKAQEAADYANRDDGLSPEDLPEKNLTIGKLDDGNSRDEPQPDKPKTWVQKKIDHYTELAQTGKIADFSYDKENKNEFVASFNNASIHYTSEDNVQISDNAGINVFETILNEEENKNRNINFAQNMPHDMAMRLKAACMLHDRNMGGEIPDFTQADLEKLSQELGAERFRELQEKIAAQDQKKSLPARVNNNENVDENKGEKSLSDAVEELKRIRKDFEQMKADGKIVVKTNPETKLPEIVSGPALEGKPVDEKLQAVKDANALIAEAGELVKSGAKTADNTKEVDAKTNNDFNHERMSHIRDNMNADALAAHEAKADQVALIHAKRMGLISDKVVRKVKEGDKFVEKEVETIKDDAERKAYADARSSDMKARIDKVVEKSKQSTR